MTRHARLLPAALLLLAALPAAAQIEMLPAPGAGTDAAEDTLLPGAETPPEEDAGPAPGEVNSLFRLRGSRPPEAAEGETPEDEAEAAATPEFEIPEFTRPESRTLAGDRAVLRVLDKMSGAVRDLEIGVGEAIRTERLEIAMAACRTQPPELPDDGFAWLSIRDLREDAPRFQGWMIASAPSVSALDHQRYDVWVLSCSASSAETSSESAKKSQ